MNRLKELRKEKKLTLDDVSKAVGISNPTLSRYEKGTRNPKIENWEKLANFFGVSVGYLQGKGVSQNEMLNFLIDMLTISWDITNPITKEEISDYLIQAPLLYYLDAKTIKKISLAIPLSSYYSKELNYTYVSINDIKKYGLDSIFIENDLDDFGTILEQSKSVRKIVESAFLQNVPLLKDWDFLESFETPVKDMALLGVSYLDINEDITIIRVCDKLHNDKLKLEEPVLEKENKKRKKEKKDKAQREKSQYGFSLIELEEVAHDFGSFMFFTTIGAETDSTFIKSESINTVPKNDKEKNTNVKNYLDKLIPYLQNCNDKIKDYLEDDR